MVANETLGMELEATLSDKTGSGIAGIETSIKQLGATVSNVGTRIDKDLGDSLSHLGPAIDRASGSLPGLIGGISQVKSGFLSLMTNPLVAITTGAITATASLAAFTISQSDTIHHLTMLSEQTGLTVSSLSGLRKAGAESGLGVETIANAAIKLETNMGKGGKALKQLGIDAKDPVDAMAQIADKFEKSDSQAQRAAIGNAAFGRSWKEMTPLLQEGGKALRDAAEGSAMSQETIDAYNSLHETMRQIGIQGTIIKKTLAEALAGPISEIAESFLGTLKTVTGLGDGANVLKTVLNYTAKDVGTLAELLEDAAVIVKGGLLMAFDTVANVALTLVKSVSTLGVGISKIIELTGHGKGMEEFFQGGYNWATKLSEELDGSVAKSVTEIGNRLAGTGDRMRALWAETENTPEKKKKLGMGEGGSEKKEKSDTEAKIDEQYAAFRTKLAAENLEQLHQIQSRAAQAELKEQKDSRQREIQLYDITFQAEQRKVAGNTDALKALQQAYRSEIAAINRKWNEKDEADKEKKEKEGLKRFAAIEKQKSEAAQKELEKQEKAYDKTWGRIVNTTGNSLATMITTHGSMTARIQAAEDALYNGLINDGAQWLASTLEDYVKRQVLGDAMRTAEAAKSAAAAAEAAARAELTGKALTSAYSTAAAMASVASFGSADIAGTTALAATVASAKGLALAGGGMNFGGALVGDGGRAEISTPTVPQRITQTSNSTVNNSYGGGTIIINTGASVDRVAAVAVRATTRQARGMVRSSR